MKTALPASVSEVGGRPGNRTRIFAGSAMSWRRSADWQVIRAIPANRSSAQL